MIYKSRFPDVEIPKTDVFNLLLGDLDEEAAARPAVTELHTENTITYGELKQKSEALAGALAKRGITKGDVVALQIPNSINYVIALFAIMRLGAIVAPVGALLNQADLEKILDLSGAKLFIGFTDVEEYDQIWHSELVSLIDAGHEAPEVSIDPEDLFAIPFSSGTTGLPKGVMLTHRNIVSNIEQTIVVLDANKLQPHTRMLSPLPFTHIYGMTALLLSQLRRGHHVFTMPKFDMKLFLEAHPKYQIQWTFIAPPMAVTLVKHPDVNPEHFASLKTIFSGAAPLDDELGRALEKRLDVEVIQGYGMTETSPAALVGVREHDVPGSVGTAVPNTEFRIMELDSDKDVAEGEAGEIVVRGPQVTQGYLNNEEATREALIGDGWLRTGDVARVGDNGSVFLVDRSKEVIKYKGYQVAPAELEALLLTHPDVSDVGVVGQDRDGLEIPRAFVVKQQGADINEQELMEWVAQRVTPYKKVRAVTFIDEIPKNATGKILRRELRLIP